MAHSETAGQDQDGDQQGRQEEPHPLQTRGGGPGGGVKGAVAASPEAQGGGEGHDQYKSSVSEVAQVIASEKGQSEHSPEEGVSASPGISGVSQAEQREAGEHQARQGIDLREADHGGDILLPKRRMRAP